MNRIGLAVSVLVLGACAINPGDETTGPVPTGEAQQPIIGGSADTTHQAVVFIGLQTPQGQAGCSGTIIKTDPDTHEGWVLTAAHCTSGAQPFVVLQGNNYNSQSVRQYEVTSYKAHPQYNPNSVANDYGMIHISGVDASTPTMPIIGGSDGLGGGDQVTTVGYGTTNDASTGQGQNNTVRNKVVATIGSLTTTEIHYDFNGKGSCHGDSGGPSFITVGGVETVVGIVSHGLTQQDCLGDGADARVSGGLSFINGELAKSTVGDTCVACQNAALGSGGACQSSVDACANDSDCGPLLECLNTCGSSDQNCSNDCVSQHEAGISLYLAAAYCPCNDACASECSTSDACSDVPKCGISVPENDDCYACAESSCCSELADAAADKVGLTCLTSQTLPSGCSSNDAYKDFNSCLASKCNSQCGGSGTTSSSSGGGASSSGGGDDDDDATSGDDDSASADDDDDSSSKKKSSSSGCAAAPGGTSSSPLSFGFALAGVALLARARRRRSA